MKPVSLGTLLTSLWSQRMHVTYIGSYNGCRSSPSYWGFTQTLGRERYIGGLQPAGVGDRNRFLSMRCSGGMDKTSWYDTPCFGF